MASISTSLRLLGRQCTGPGPSHPGPGPTVTGLSKPRRRLLDSISSAAAGGGPPVVTATAAQRLAGTEDVPATSSGPPAIDRYPGPGHEAGCVAAPRCGVTALQGAFRGDAGVASLRGMWPGAPRRGRGRQGWGSRTAGGPGPSGAFCGKGLAASRPLGGLEAAAGAAASVKACALDTET
jgi:hypothetical protein